LGNGSFSQCISELKKESIFIFDNFLLLTIQFEGFELIILPFIDLLELFLAK